MVALSLLAGFQSHVRGRLLAETPHLLVSPSGRGVFRAEEGIAARLAKGAGVVSASPVVRGRVWLAARGLSVPAEAVGREGTAGLSIDPSQARALAAFPGEEVTLVSSRSRLSPLGPVPIVATLAVADVSAVSPAARRLPEARLPIAEARRLLGLPDGAASGYEVRLADPGALAAAAEEVRRSLGGTARVTTWEEAHRPLVLALRLERVVHFATVFLIVVVAGLNLAATSAVLAATRSLDAAILAVLGASPRQVASVFVAAGALVGAIGTVSGLALGTAVALALDRTQAIPLPTRLYSLSHVPFRPDPKELAVVLVLSLAWSVAVTLGPARQAARRDVGEALRGA